MPAETNAMTSNTPTADCPTPAFEQWLMTYEKQIRCRLDSLTKREIRAAWDHQQARIEAACPRNPNRTPLKDDLSVEQRGVIDRMRASKAKLVRLPDGFWTTEGTPEVKPGVPAWYTGVRTVRALERKGYLQRTLLLPDEWRDPREIPGC